MGCVALSLSQYPTHPHSPSLISLSPSLPPSLLTESPSHILKDPSYNDLRAEAAVHAKLRAENFQKAAHARSKKQFQVAVYYAQQVSGLWPEVVGVAS